jgi:hypothetical protein
MTNSLRKLESLWLDLLGPYIQVSIFWREDPQDHFMTNFSIYI